MSGAWSLDIDVPLPKSNCDAASDIDATFRPATSGGPRRSLTSIRSTSLSLSRRPIMRHPPTHRDLLFLLAFAMHWGLVLFYYLSFASAHFRTDVFMLENSTWALLFMLAALFGTIVGALVHSG
jgi:hypothetical protein